MAAHPQWSLPPGRDAYVTGPAIDGARQRGFDFALSEWRDAFLAITDCLAADGSRSLNGSITSAYVGPLRDGMERWAVSYRGRRLDVMYDPRRALIFRVADPPGSVLASPPEPSRPPLSAAAVS